MADFTVTLQPSNQTFQVAKNELILDAAIRQGIEVAYSCRNGTCRTCLFQLQEGEAILHDADLCMITEQELSSGRRLLCMSSLKSDAVFEKPVRARDRKNA